MKESCYICKKDDGSEYVKFLCQHCKVFVHIDCARTSGKSWLSLTIMQEISTQHRECSRSVTLA